MSKADIKWWAAVFIGLTLLFTFTCIRDAQASGFGIQIGPHIDTSPGHNGCYGSTLTYCTGNGPPGTAAKPPKPIGGVGYGDDSHHYLHRLWALHKRRKQQRCKIYHLKYIMRHPFFKPASLRGLNGCPLWSADDAFHTADPPSISIKTRMIEALNPNAN